jgi:hypothetical protein
LNSAIAMMVQTIVARRPPAPELAKNPRAIGRMARSAALLRILGQPSPAQRVNGGARRFFHRLFLARLSRATYPSQTRHARMGETTTATPLRRRGLVHASEPARDLRDAHAAGVTSPFPDWVRRSQLVYRWHPYHRHYEEPCGKQTNDAYEYQNFLTHFPPPLLNRHPPDDPI